MASSDYQRKQRQAELEAQENLNSAQEDELAGLQAINRERERELEHTKDLAKSLQKNLGLMEEQGDALRGIN